jgi:hypothetical protein
MTLAPRLSPERLVELARGIVRGDYMTADPDDREWQASLILMAAKLAECQNMGAVLVPMGPHRRGLWLNGRVPAVTFEVVVVPGEDIPELRRLVINMNMALWPEQKGDG